MVWSHGSPFDSLEHAANEPLCVDRMLSVVAYFQIFGYFIFPRREHIINSIRYSSRHLRCIAIENTYKFMSFLTYKLRGCRRNDSAIEFGVGLGGGCIKERSIKIFC